MVCFSIITYFRWSYAFWISNTCSDRPFFFKNNSAVKINLRLKFATWCGSSRILLFKEYFILIWTFKSYRILKREMIFMFSDSIFIVEGGYFQNLCPFKMSFSLIDFIFLKGIKWFFKKIPTIKQNSNSDFFKKVNWLVAWLNENQLNSLLLTTDGWKLFHFWLYKFFLTHLRKYDMVRIKLTS